MYPIDMHTFDDPNPIINTQLDEDELIEQLLNDIECEEIEYENIFGNSSRPNGCDNATQQLVKDERAANEVIHIKEENASDDDDDEDYTFIQSLIKKEEPEFDEEISNLENLEDQLIDHLNKGTKRQQNIAQPDEKKAIILKYPIERAAAPKNIVQVGERKMIIPKRPTEVTKMPQEIAHVGEKKKPFTKCLTGVTVRSLLEQKRKLLRRYPTESADEEKATSQKHPMEATTKPQIIIPTVKQEVIFHRQQTSRCPPRFPRQMASDTKKKFQCRQCEYSTDNSSSLSKHIAVHLGIKPHECDLCGARFTQKSNKKSHMMTHTGERPYECDVCGEQYSRKLTLETHKRSHTGERPYTCEICGRTFAHRTAVNLHMRTHTGHRPYKCDLCQKTFGFKQNLDVHRLVHTGERPFVCEYCDRRFSLYKNLIEHKRVHTGEKPYGCDYENCSERFAHLWSLKIHKRKHDGTKAFGCAVCLRRFWQKSNLTKHLLLHERPYACNICDHKCSNKQHLHDHMTAHTGERPFKCNLCNLAFAQSSNLSSHKQQMHKSKVLLEIEIDHGYEARMKAS